MSVAKATPTITTDAWPTHDRRRRPRHRDPRRRPGARRRDQLPPLRARGCELLGDAGVTSQKPVSGNGAYASANFTPTAAGTYRWTANYSGDSDNAAATSPCNAAGESVTVVKASPTLSTDASPGTELGGSVHDTATLAGGRTPGGEISFRLYGPADTDCTKPPAFTNKKTVAGNGDYDPPPSPRPPPASTAGPPSTRAIPTTPPRPLPATPPARRSASPRRPRP